MYHNAQTRTSVYIVLTSPLHDGSAESFLTVQVSPNSLLDWCIDGIAFTVIYDVVVAVRIVARQTITHQVTWRLQLHDVMDGPAQTVMTSRSIQPPLLKEHQRMILNFSYDWWVSVPPHTAAHTRSITYIKVTEWTAESAISQASLSEEASTQAFADKLAGSHSTSVKRLQDLMH